MSNIYKLMLISSLPVVLHRIEKYHTWDRTAEIRWNITWEMSRIKIAFPAWVHISMGDDWFLNFWSHLNSFSLNFDFKQKHPLIYTQSYHKSVRNICISEKGNFRHLTNSLKSVAWFLFLLIKTKHNTRGKTMLLRNLTFYLEYKIQNSLDIIDILKVLQSKMFSF